MKMESAGSIDLAIKPLRAALAHARPWRSRAWAVELWQNSGGCSCTIHYQVVDSNTVVGILDITKLLFDVISALEKADWLRLLSHSSRTRAHERMVEALWLVHRRRTHPNL
jgi:hypothetical protein